MPSWSLWKHTEDSLYCSNQMVKILEDSFIVKTQREQKGDRYIHRYCITKENMSMCAYLPIFSYGNQAFIQVLAMMNVQMTQRELWRLEK